MTSPLTIQFSAGDQGSWRIDDVVPIIGETLPAAPCLDTGPVGDPGMQAGPCAWRLLGTLSNTRYSHRSELTELATRQEGLGRPHARQAVLIPIRKSPAWWALAQDERRAIFEEQSRHIGIGMDYLPAIARRLHHSRDLGEPFDFLTWFEFAPEDEARFADMLKRLRETVEWSFIDREVEIRLSRVQ